MAAPPARFTASRRASALLLSAARRHSSAYGVKAKPTYMVEALRGSRTSGPAWRWAGRALVGGSQRSPPSGLRYTPRSVANRTLGPVTPTPRTCVSSSGSGRPTGCQRSPRSSLRKSWPLTTAHSRGGSAPSRATTSARPDGGPTWRDCQCRAPLTPTHNRPPAIANTASGGPGSTTSASTCSSGSPSSARAQELPQSSLRYRPLQPARYTRPAVAPWTSARAGAARAGAWMMCQRSPSERKMSEAPEATARTPSESYATAKAAPISTSGAWTVQSRPPLRDARTPLSVARRRWLGSAGLMARAMAPLTKLPELTENQVAPPSRGRKSPPHALASCPRAVPGHSAMLSAKIKVARRHGSGPRDKARRMFPRISAGLRAELEPRVALAGFTPGGQPTLRGGRVRWHNGIDAQRPVRVSRNVRRFAVGQDQLGGPPAVPRFGVPPVGRDGVGGGGRLRLLGWGGRVSAL